MASTTPPSGDEKATSAREPDLKNDPALRKLEEDEKKKDLKAKIAAHEQKIAEAEKKVREAQLPESTVQLLEGKTELGDNVGLVGDLLAHGVLALAATNVASDVKSRISDASDAVVLIIEDPKLVEADWPYEAIRQELGHHKRTLTRAFQEISDVLDSGLKPEPIFARDEHFAIVPAVTALSSAAPAVLGAAASVIGLFRSDYAIKHRSVTVGVTPVTGAVARALIDKEVSVVVDAFHLLRDSRIVDDFWACWRLRSEIELLALILDKDAERGRSRPRLFDALTRRRGDADSDESERADRADGSPRETEGPGIERSLADDEPADNDRTRTPGTDVARQPADLSDETEQERAASGGRERAHAEVEGVGVDEVFRYIDEEQSTRRNDEPLSDDARAAFAKLAIARFDSFAEAATKAPEGSPYPPLVTAALVERLRFGAEIGQRPMARTSSSDESEASFESADGADGARTRVTHVLHVAVEAAGGETITHRSLFSLGGTVGFVGGVNVSHLLVDLASDRTVGAGSETFAAQLKYELRTGSATQAKRIVVTATQSDDRRRDRPFGLPAVTQITGLLALVGVVALIWLIIEWLT
jgi:hypothetical protein